jgi:hypothetical protein
MGKGNREMVGGGKTGDEGEEEKKEEKSRWL